ncbi:MAG: ATP-binding protein, partial [Micrococcales bacterium]|nr:ATP-binding protein [Micrococcales bacterium]
MIGSPDSADPFGTAKLRHAVLTAWRASAARFREDANTEEDHARTYYRDRVLVDLAQNAADAAVRSGEPGRLLIRLEPEPEGYRLVVANTGTPLDADGVASLACMRASAKRTQTQATGRFGVGFAAVRSVSDEVEVRSTAGTVRFSLAKTRDMLADVQELDDEVARRGDALPVLRLPLAAPCDPWPGYDTAVVVHLRDDDAVATVRAQLDQVGDPMLLGLPGLAEIVVQTPEVTRRIAEVTDRWHVATAAGTLDPQVLADRPVEERARDQWQVTWALPRGDQELVQVVHAPTPTDDPCTVPALLIATFPLDPTRRRVQPDSAVTEVVVAAAAQTYAALVSDVVAGGADVSTLVPTGLALGELDARLHDAVVDALRHAPVLHGRADLLMPTDAVALEAPVGHDRTLVAALACHLPTLVDLPANPAVLRVLDVPVRSLADIVEDLPDAGRWADLYAAVGPHLPEQAEALAHLPVCLADGRVVRGARGTVILDESCVASLTSRALAALARWGLRIVDPGAAHPVLERLGATRPEVADLLSSPQVRHAVDNLQDDQGWLDEPDGCDEEAATWAGADLRDAGLGEVAAVVAELVATAPMTHTSTAVSQRLAPVLGLVELPAADGDLVPAHGLVLPGSPAQRLFDDRVLTTVSPKVVDLLGEPVLRALGVRGGPVLVQVSDVVADRHMPGDVDLDGWPDYLAWLADRLGQIWVGDVTAVADLDAVAHDAWPALLAAVGADRDLRAAVVDPVRTPEGVVSSYTAWWLTRRAGIGLGAPFAVGDVPGWLAHWLPPAPEVLADTDDEIRRALGGISTGAGLDLDTWATIMSGVAAGTSVDLPRAVEVWRALASVPEVRSDPDGWVLPALVAPSQAEMLPVASLV